MIATRRRQWCRPTARIQTQTVARAVVTMRQLACLVALLGFARGFLAPGGGLALRATQQRAAPATCSITFASSSEPEPDDDEDLSGLDAMNPDGTSVAELKAHLEEAQKNGDTDKIITLMGTLLSLEGAYDAEGADDDEPWSPREK